MKEIVLDTGRGSVTRATNFIEETLASLGVPRKVILQLCIVVDEVFSNIVRYAYGPGVGMAIARVGFDEASQTVTLVFIDEGTPFDPRTTKEPDITLPIEERPIGGLGLFMVKKTMDDVDYRREDGRNVLTLTKRIEG